MAERYRKMAPFLTEKQRRIFLGNEAESLGKGGISKVAKYTGSSWESVKRGMRELNTPEEFSFNQIRKPGGGRKKTVEKDKSLMQDLDTLISPATRGEPESPLRWSCKSLRNLSESLKSLGHKTSHRMVGELLKSMGYSLQANRKTKEGGAHPDRNAQFEYINERVNEYHCRGNPSISVDAKKKENIGEYYNKGAEWHPKREAEEVNVYDFIDKKKGKVTPYGIYDMAKDSGWVNVGIDHDTAEFAVESIRRWWNQMGKEIYKDCTNLLITADGGGSNGSRNRLWKKELQKFATEAGLDIELCHFPPGTSKWNKIEHRLFSRISQNWRARPLTSYEVVVNCIASTKTKKGLKVVCELDRNTYKKGIKVSDDEIEQINLVKSDFHGEWNYAILHE